MIEGNASSHSTSALEHAVQGACARIAPAWPLDRFIATNPLWGLIGAPLVEVAGELQALTGASLLMPRAWYRQAYREGRLRDAHLAMALQQSGSGLSLSAARALLHHGPASAPRRSRVLDVVDAGRDLAHEQTWRAFVTHSVSQSCAAFFDDGQASLGPVRDAGLFACWRSYAVTDRAPVLLMGLTSYPELVRDVPASARETLSAALTALQVPEAEWQTYLWSLLLDQHGWASWCAYRRWTARLAGGDDDALVDLLAIRLAWEWMVWRGGGEGAARRWKLAMASWKQPDSAAGVRADEWVLQLATELAWQQPVLDALARGCSVPRPRRPQVQAVFCIDVRSERLRRALEAVSPGVQTLGFAGFFGLPLEVRPAGPASARPQLPGLLAPRLVAAEVGLDAADQESREAWLQRSAAWRALRTDALSGFGFVDAFGLTYARKLLSDSLHGPPPARGDGAGLPDAAKLRRKPRLVATIDGAPVSDDERCQLAAGMLRAMSLTRDFARLVLLVGHGSTTRNNPHAAGLDCGACCGQTGEVNARVAAALLNEPAVRAGLPRLGLEVPADTWFLPALHDTTTDEVELFELEEVPASHLAECRALQQELRTAGARVRAERAKSLGVEATEGRLLRALRARAADWSQVRPEWGLANNAAFIAAPRERTRHLELEGRVFLHEYRQDEDPEHRVLELIMTAPVVVAHWINFQYYASTVDNELFGSGNKVLHNIVGGHLGVFEGNGGDLRIGLPLQSLHDGRTWRHEPLRLTVILEAPRSAIDGVLARHAHLRALVDGGWLHLVQLDVAERRCYARRGGLWWPSTTDDSAQQRAG